MAEPLLRGFSERQRSLPGRIILYRGGLDEMHYPQVLQAEVSDTHEATSVTK